jgi:hypothetical protein
LNIPLFALNFLDNFHINAPRYQEVKSALAFRVTIGYGKDSDEKGTFALDLFHLILSSHET